MNQDHFNQFWHEYERHYIACVRAHPQRYGPPLEEVPLVARKVRERFSRDGISTLDIESEIFQLTCRTLGIEHTREAIESFLTPGSASVPNLNTEDKPNQEASPISAADAERWARDWFAGSAHCPRCANDYTIFVGRVSTDAESRIETWHCHQCTHSWKIEFRECAANVDDDAQPSHWIEREEIEGDLLTQGKSSSTESIRQELDAAITRLSNAAYACGEWSSDSEERYDELCRESALARRSLEALCAQMWSGEMVAPAMESSPPPKVRLCSKEDRERIGSHWGHDALPPSQCTDPGAHPGLIRRAIWVSLGRTVPSLVRVCASTPVVDRDRRANGVGR